MIMKTKIYKTSNFSILTSHYYCLFSLLFLLGSFFSYAQTYEWQWAKNGGGSLKIQGESGSQINNNGGLNLEHIQNIIIDEDNNYYFLGKIAHGNSHVDGNEVTTFGSTTQGYSNIIITSFTCDGTYRWSRVIGGRKVSLGRAYKLVLDNEGAIYVSVLYVASEIAGNNNQPPACFGEGNCLPYL